MDRVEEGIANYRLFQARVASFIVRADTRAEDEATHAQEIKDAIASRDKRMNLRLTVAAVVISLFMAWMAYRDSQRKLSFIEPQAGQQQSQPQQGDMPPGWVPSK